MVNSTFLKKGLKILASGEYFSLSSNCHASFSLFFILLPYGQAFGAT